MVTARRHATARVRPAAGLLRVLGAALMLWCLLWAHGTDAHGDSGRSGSGHGAPPAATAAGGPGAHVPAPTPPTAPADARTTTLPDTRTAAPAPLDGHGAAHPVHGCEPLTPRQASPAEAAPCGPPPATRTPGPGDPYAHPGVEDGGHPAPPPRSHAPVVLRV
ncbi:hypothetical protein [Streptomyces sp. NPDC048606]|uniref:hypothetical protein n=1 Tax=Streptomyces sp. NPDC048606 TaxID=3154726 RepID=UPI0034350D23